MKPEIDASCSPEGCTNPPLPLPLSLAYPIPWRGPLTPASCWGPKQIPSALNLVDMICSGLVSGEGVLQEGFGLSSSPILPRRGAGLWCGLV